MNEKKQSNEAKQPPLDKTFSEYIARLGRGEDVDLADYEAVREKLRGALVGELRRRGLWSSPPAFLGCVGSGWSDGALDELVTDAYTFTFIERLDAMLDQQRLKPNIEPMVFRNVSNFLNDLQKKADPLGYRLFTRLRGAIKNATNSGQVSILNGEAINNGTVLRLASSTETVLAAREALMESVRRWNDDLLPDLVIAEGRAVPKVVDRLAEKLLGFADEGITTFRFGDLVRELKNDVRKRWQASWEKSLGDLEKEYSEDGSSRAIQLTEFDDEPDWARRMILIQECVEASIEKESAPKGRRDLRSLWFWIRAERVETEQYGKLPSLTEIGDRLEIHRDRIRQLYERLKPMVESCLKTAGHSSTEER